MRVPIVKHVWEYEIINETTTKYGYRCVLYKDGKVFHSQGGLGSEAHARCEVVNYFLEDEFGIE